MAFGRSSSFPVHFIASLVFEPLKTFFIQTVDIISKKVKGTYFNMTSLSPTLTA